MSSKLLSRLPRPTPPTLSRSARLSLSRRASTSHGSASPAHPPRRSIVFTAGVALGSLATGYAVAVAAPRPPVLSLLFPMPTAAAPAADSAEGRAHAARIEAQLQALPVVREMRARRVEAAAVTAAGTALELAAGQVEAGGPRSELIKEFTEARPYAKGAGPHSLTGFSLRGPGK